MNRFRLTFTVYGKRTEQIVTAKSYSDAKNLIRMQYSGAHINFISTGKEYL